MYAMKKMSVSRRPVLGKKWLLFLTMALNYAITSGCLYMFTAGMYLGWSTQYALHFLRKNATIDMINIETIHIQTTEIVGSAIGALTLLKLLNGFGRKSALVASTVPYIVGTSMMFYDTNTWLFLLGHFSLAVSFSVVMPSVMIFFGEIAPAETRGGIILAQLLTLKLGYSMSCVLVIYLEPRYYIAIALFTAVVAALTIQSVPESPYFYVCQNMYKEAKNSLLYFREGANVDDEFTLISKTVESDKSYCATRFVNVMTTVGTRRPLVIMLLLQMFSFFSGSQIIANYSKEILAATGKDLDYMYLIFLFGSLEVACVLIMMPLVNNVGRRIFLLFSTIGVAASMLALSVLFFCHQFKYDTSNYPWFSFACLLSFMIFYCFGLSTIPYLLIGEMLPLSVKSYGSCILLCFNGVYISLTIQLYKILYHHDATQYAFLLFAAMQICGAFWIYFGVPETNRKTLHNLQLELRGDSKLLSPENLS